MDFSFVPKRLINARKEIELIHRSVSEPVKISPSNELKQLIYSLVSLEESKIKVTACCLSDRELESGSVIYQGARVLPEEIADEFFRQFGVEPTKSEFGSWSDFVCHLSDKLLCK